MNFENFAQLDVEIIFWSELYYFSVKLDDALPHVNFTMSILI